MKVFKFGGSCLETVDNLRRAADIVEGAAEYPVCVLSALKGVTDQLLALSNQALSQEVDLTPLRERHAEGLSETKGIHRRETEVALDELWTELKHVLLGIHYLGELSNRVRDRILSFGERLSVTLFTGILESRGLATRSWTGMTLGIETEGEHGDARILPSSSQTVRSHLLAEPAVHVITGFIGRDTRGAITTLGRGGSDYTASFIASALEAELVLWKDVGGLWTCDPKLVPEARRLTSLDYMDALEMAHYGLEAIHDKAIRPARQGNVPITIRGFEEGDLTTVISADAVQTLAVAFVREAVIFDVTDTTGEMLVLVADLLRFLSNLEIFPLLLTEASAGGETSLVVRNQHAKVVHTFLNGRPEEIDFQANEEVGVVSMIGAGMVGQVGFAARIFETLAGESINILAISQTASERNVSVIVERLQTERAVRALHRSFIEEKNP